jgi:lipoprotein NlpD
MTFRFASPRFALTLTTLLVLAGCAGRSLNVAPPVEDWSDSRLQPAPIRNDKPLLYTVRKGDTLTSIAARFNTTPANLIAWNNLGSTSRLAPDQVLRVSPPLVTGGAPVANGNTAPVATTSPIGSENVEQRPLGAPTAPLAAPSSSSNAPLKTGPLGIKHPYSDAAFAEMSRPDGGDASSSPAPVVAPPASSAAAVAPPSDTVSWAWPASGKPTAMFVDGRTKGIDIPGKAGDPVLAAADGKVTFAGTGVRGYGNFVIVKHTPELLSVYAHNRANLVKEGSVVTKGQKIAEMGNSDTDGVNLHFEIRSDSKPVDPLKYLPAR